jgi:hypothetical protein
LINQLIDQDNRVTIGGTPTGGDVFSISINLITTSVTTGTSTGTYANILIDHINANGSIPVTASQTVSGVINLVPDTPGTDFTLAGLSGQGILNVEVFSIVSCSSVVSIPFTIFDVNPGTIGDDSTHCASENPDTIANTASATSLISSVTFTYYWQSSSNSTFPDLLTSDITTVTSTHYPFSSALPATTHFRRVATASLSGVSTEVFSDEVTKTVIPSPSSINLTSNQAQNTFYHDGTTNPSIEITATANQPGLTYQFNIDAGGHPELTSGTQDYGEYGVKTGLFVDGDLTSGYEIKDDKTTNYEDGEETKKFSKDVKKDLFLN